MSKSLPPVPQNVTVFEDKTFKEEIKVKQGQQMGPNFYKISILSISKKIRLRHRHRGKTM